MSKVFSNLGKSVISKFEAELISASNSLFSRKFKFMVFVIFCFLSDGNLYAQTSNWVLADSCEIFLNNSQYRSELRYESIDCADSMNCVAIANLQRNLPWVKVTSDGGKTWVTTLSDTNIHQQFYWPPKICEVSYPDTNLCIIVGDTNNYWRSTDHCRTWKKAKYIAPYSKNQAFEFRVDMYNSQFGGLVTPRVLLLTSDGGLSWFQPKINLPDSTYPTAFSDLAVKDGSIIIAMAYNPNFIDYIIRSDDFGMNWVAYPTIPRRLRRINFINKLIGWGVGGEQVETTGISRNNILHTTDGGKTWEIQLDSMPKKLYGLNKVKFFDSLHGMARGSFYNYWMTTNGGKIWLRDTSYTYDEHPNIELMNMAYLTKDKILGVTSDSKIYLYSDELVNIAEEVKFISNNDIQIFPNPAEEYIEISVGSQNAVTNPDIRILNVFGEEIIKISDSNNSQFSIPNSQFRINVSGLPTGVYFMRVGDKVSKFVKI